MFIKIQIYISYVFFLRYIRKDILFEVINPRYVIMPLIKEELTIKPVHKLLDDPLAIPEYQRPYRWTTKSTSILLSDIYEAFKTNIPEYRIGSVVLHKHDGKYDVVDGQQRLTTLSIIFYVLKEENLLSDEYKNRKTSLLEQKYTANSNAAIVQNYEVVKSKIKSIVDNGNIEQFTEYLFNNCTFVNIVTDCQQEAFQFFDSQNSRGKALAPHDLLKSYHLREMNDDPEKYKIELINKWENTDQTNLENLFSENLYPLVNWFKTKDGLYYSSDKIDNFKGIQKGNNYNFSIYNRAANLFIEKFNTEKHYELVSASALNQFQLTQPIIAGKNFFNYSLHYLQLLEKVKNLADNFINEKYLLKNTGRVGDLYVYSLFLNALVFFADRFNLNSLTKSRILFFHKWAYSLRLTMQAVYQESINKYALGKSNRINENLNIFESVSQMIEARELDSIVLHKIKSENLNNKYKDIYNFIFEDSKVKNDDK